LAGRVPDWSGGQEDPDYAPTTAAMNSNVRKNVGVEAHRADEPCSGRMTERHSASASTMM